MLPNNKKNNEAAIQQDNIIAIRIAIEGFRVELDWLIKESGIKTSELKDGLFEIDPAQPATAISRLKHFSNLVTYTENAILCYDQFNKDRSYQTLARNLAPNILATRTSFNAVIKNKEIENGVAKEILAPITEETDYHIGLALIKFLETIYQYPNPFRFIQPLVNGSALISVLLPTFSSNLTTQKLKQTIDNSQTTLEETLHHLRIQLNRSPYFERVNRDFQKYDKQITSTDREYQKTVAGPVKEALNANMTAIKKLAGIERDYASLPNQLRINSTDALEVKASLAKNTKEKLDALKQDQLRFIGILKKEYEEKTKTITPVASIPAPNQDDVQEAAQLIEKAKTETNSFQERATAASSAKQKYQAYAERLAERITKLKTEKNTAETNLNVPGFLSGLDEDANALLKKEIGSIYTNVIQEYNASITAAQDELNEITLKQDTVNELQAAFSVQQLVVGFFQGEANQDKCKKSIALTSMQISTKRDRIASLKKEADEQFAVMKEWEEEVNDLPKKQQEILVKIEEYNQQITDTIQLIKEKTAALDQLKEQCSTAQAEYNQLNRIFSIFRNKQQKERHKKLHDLLQTYEQKITLATTTISELNKKLQLRPDIFSQYTEHRAKHNETRTLTDHCTPQELIVINKKELELVTDQYLPEARATFPKIKTLYDETMSYVNEAGTSLDMLEGSLYRLTAADNLFDVNNQLAAAAALVKATEERTRTLLQTPSSFDLMVSLFKESTQYNADDHFPTLTKKLRSISEHIATRPNEKEFGTTVSALLKEKEDALNKYNTRFKQTLTERREAAEKEAVKIAATLTSSLNELTQKLNKIQLSIVEFEDDDKKMMLLKLIQRQYCSPQDVKLSLENISLTIASYIETITTLHEDISNKKSILENKVADKAAYTDKLDINGLFSSVNTLLNNYNKSKDSLKSTDQTILDHCKRLDDLSKTTSDFINMLDNYEKYRSRCYFLKDLFSSADKKARHQFITELKTTLHKFCNLNEEDKNLAKLKLEPYKGKSIEEKLITLIEEGIIKFPPGKMSNTKDPTKNLRGILELLKARIAAPRAAHQANILLT